GGRPLQAGRRAPRDLRRQGHRSEGRDDRLLPDRRAERAHLVRPEVPARPRARPELRRLVDGMGLPHRGADRDDRGVARLFCAGRTETLSTARYPRPRSGGDPSAARGPSVPPPDSLEGLLGASFSLWILSIPAKA